MNSHSKQNFASFNTLSLQNLYSKHWNDGYYEIFNKGMFNHNKENNFSKNFLQHIFNNNIDIVSKIDKNFATVYLREKLIKIVLNFPKKEVCCNKYMVPFPICDPM